MDYFSAWQGAKWWPQCTAIESGPYRMGGPLGPGTRKFALVTIRMILDYFQRKQREKIKQKDFLNISVSRLLIVSNGQNFKAPWRNCQQLAADSIGKSMDIALNCW